jgi:phosphatidylinositol glycan class U
MAQQFAQPQLAIQLGFITIDVLCTLLLFALPYAYARTQSYEYTAPDIIQSYQKRNKAKIINMPMIKASTIEEMAKLLPKPSPNLPVLLAAAYLLNPFSIACCVALSTQLPLNLLVIATALLATSQSIILSSITLACAIYMSPYLLVLILPAALLITSGNMGPTTRKVTCIVFSIFTLVFVGSLLVLSYHYMGGDLDHISELEGNRGWTFLDRVYGFQFFVEDLQPNIGVSWYFHTEVFQHFRLLFLFVFQYHVFIYTIPICYKFSDHPLSAFWILLTIVSTFKSYPSLADIALFMSLYPMLNHLMNHMTYKTLIATGALTCACLMPIMWRMWIWTGTGNANFYFAICVGLAVTYGLLIIDYMESVLIRDFLLKRLISADIKQKQDAPAIISTSEATKDKPKEVTKESTTVELSS